MPRPTVGKLNERSLRQTYLRQWRKYRGYSLERSAEMIGVTHGLLSKIERAKKPYNQAFLEAAADAYGCEPSDLLEIDPLLANDVTSLLSFRRARTEDGQREIVEEIVRNVMKAAR